MKGERTASIEETYLAKRANRKSAHMIEAQKERSRQPPKNRLLKCPECASQRIWKDGLRYVKTETGEKIAVQRYLCRTCGRRFSETSQPQVKVNIRRKLPILSEPVHNLGHLNGANVLSANVGLEDPAFTPSKDIASHGFTVVGKTINTFLPNSRERQVCATESVAKNLSHQLPQQKRAAGATKQDIKGLIINFLWYMQKENYAASTIQRYGKEIELLAKRGANLLDSESVKEVIAEQKWCDNRKAQVYWVCDLFFKMLGKTWEMPRIRTQQKIGFCPTEKTVNQAIAGLGKKVSTKVQLTKETGIRSGEADKLEWSQINFKTATIAINPEKGSNPTVKKVSRELLGRIQTLPRVSEKIFGDLAYNSMRTNLCQQRKKLAEKLGNPELLRLTFVSMRHFYGTKLYHQGKTLLEIQKIMGHKRFTSTLQYINYEKQIYGGTDEWICKVVESEEDRKKLIQQGFQFVEQVDHQSYYRKPKE